MGQSTPFGLYSKINIDSFEHVCRRYGITDNQEKIKLIRSINDVFEHRESLLIPPESAATASIRVLKRNPYDDNHTNSR